MSVDRSSATLLKKRKRKRQSLFVTPKAFVIFAKINGKSDGETRIAGSTLDELLSNCTQILKLTSAARKLYLEDGTLVESVNQLKNNPEVYVSQGEPFIDQVKLFRESLNLKERSFWGLNGLYIPKSTPKNLNSNNEIEQIKKNWRVLTFKNGEYLPTGALEIISDLKNLEEFKSLCGSRHNFNGQCKRVFSVNCTEIFDLNQLLEEESFVWNPNCENLVLGPVWASMGEDFKSSSLYSYFGFIHDIIKKLLKKERRLFSELNAMSNGELDSVHTSSIKSYSKQELAVRKKDSEDKLMKLQKDVSRFRYRLDNRPQSPVKECSGNFLNNFSKNAQGLRLMVYKNGQPSHKKYLFFFNLEQAKKGINDPSILFNRLMDELSKNIHLTKTNDHAKGILVRRLFTEDGIELKDVTELEYDQTLCVSYGDDWINPKCFCLSSKVHFMNEDLDEHFGDIEKIKDYEVSKKMTEKQLLYNLPVLQHKAKSRDYLMISLFISEKNIKNGSMESWSFTKDGRIFMKQFPSLSLTLLQEGKSEIKIPNISIKSKKSKGSDFEVICYTVQLYPKQFDNPYQLWDYNTSGNFSCKGDSSLYLTHLSTNSMEFHNSFFDIVSNTNLCATELLPTPLDSNQRWGFKHLDQWKLCDLPNLEWHKAALIWPYKKDGSLNNDLRWPLEGTLIVGAPFAMSNNIFENSRFPIKLNVLKNNDHRNQRATLVTGPDLTKLVRIRKHDKYETHCSNESLLLQEFEMFLAICTSTLYLPSAARRLFTKDGKELKVLEGLSNYDYVCVSMGEVWCSPEKTLSKIQLRSYSNKLEVDVERLRNFINVYKRNSELVLGIKNNILEENAQLEIQQLNNLSKKELQRISDEDNEIPIPEPVKEPSENENPIYKNVHEKTCDAAKLRYGKKKEDNTGNKENKEITQKKEYEKHSENIPCLNVQQFLYENQYIMVFGNRKFCLFADDVGKRVFLKKLIPMNDNSQCKWIIHKSGVIESLHFRGLVLTVFCSRMLPFQEKAITEYTGSVITLEKAFNTKYGNATQRFSMDLRSGLIYPLHTNELDLCITSAVLSSICTRFVSSKDLIQQGCMVDMKKVGDSKERLLPICLSCISILNGRFPISSINDYRKSFICSYSGGFKVIRNADLSFEKAEETFHFYQKKLNEIKKQLILKPCKNRVTSTTTKNIKVLLYRNGLGRLNPSQMVTGRNILQIMEMATNIFNLQRPVRILYTNSGVPIVDELSFINTMCKLVAQDSIPEMEEHIENKEIDEFIDNSLEDNEETLNITLSDDGSYFLVELEKDSSTTLYTIEIFISKIGGINQFSNGQKMSNLYFLINYEIFNNQINTDLFQNDNDFESEVTELSLKSSAKALKRLFSKDLATLRMQLISTTVENPEEEQEDMKLNINSIDAFADVNLNWISERINSYSEETISKSLVCPFISTDTFTPSSATLTVEVSLKMIDKVPRKKVDDSASIFSESIIMQPYYFPNNTSIELWASTGEPFYFPSDDDGKQLSKTKIDQLKIEVYKKKTLLRNIKGERVRSLKAGTLEATGDEKNPVKIKGNWMFPSRQEKELRSQIEILEKEVSDRKMQSSNTITPRFSGPLYSQKHMKNCLVYLNGSKESKIVSAWGESIYEIMQNAASLLQMKKTPKYLFKPDGVEVKTIEEISPDITLALSNHPNFISSEDIRLQCEIKANWGRARSKHGEKVTELQVHHRPITVIDVDPFEPPDIMKPRESVSKESKTIKIFENGQPSSSASIITGNSFASLLGKAAEVLGLTVPVKCFYTLEGKRISNFKEILNDDILAASVTGKGFIANEDY